MDTENLCLLYREDFALVAAGFEPTEEGTLWRKDGVCLGGEAALQSARKERAEYITATRETSFREGDLSAAP